MLADIYASRLRVDVMFSHDNVFLTMFVVRCYDIASSGGCFRAP